MRMHPFAMRRAHAGVMLAHVSTAEKRLRLIEFAFIRRENFGGTTRLLRNGSKATRVEAHATGYALILLHQRY
jgi:hypothetical protein